MDVLHVDHSAANAAELFSQSLQDTGFAVLYNHPIDRALIDDVYNEWQSFFASNNKLNCLYNKTTQDGFFPTSISETAKGASLKDLKEYYQYYPWGQFPKGLSNNTAELYQQLALMAQQLLGWVQSYLPSDILDALSMPLPKMIENSAKTMLRIIHYPPLANFKAQDGVRAAAHGDINLLTLLVGSTASGLQVRSANGTWHDIDCNRDTIAVNIGDMLEMCTQGYYRSTLHRVVNPQGDHGARLSMPLFLHPEPDVRLANNTTADDFLRERLTEIGVL